jgi:hypothetical protein
MPVQRRFTPIEGGAVPSDRLVDIHAVLDEYLKPAVAGLERAADDGDLAAVRAFAHEIIVGAGAVIAACPRPPFSPRTRPGGDLG